MADPKEPVSGELCTEEEVWLFAVDLRRALIIPDNVDLEELVRLLSSLVEDRDTA